MLQGGLPTTIAPRLTLAPEITLSGVVASTYMAPSGNVTVPMPVCPKPWLDRFVVGDAIGLAQLLGDEGSTVERAVGLRELDPLTVGRAC